MDSKFIKKLKIKEGDKICLINSPAGFKNKLPSGITTSAKLQGKFDAVFLFITKKTELEKMLPAAKKSLNEKAMLWVSYPKQTSKIKADINRDTGWKVLQKINLRPVAFISIDETWTSFGLRNEPIPGEKVKEINPELDKHVNKDKRIVTAPKDLEAEFKKNILAKKYFESLAFSHKKEYAEWIIGAKKPETRQARVIKTIEKLNAGKKNPSEK